MRGSRRRAVPPELERLIPQEIQKGIYYRLYRRKDGSIQLVWWVKLYDHQSRPICESTHSNSYSDAVKLHKKISAQIENQQRSGGEADSVRIGQLLDEFLADGTTAKDSTKYIYGLVIEQKLKPFFGKIRASKLTTDHTKAYREKRKTELLAKHKKGCPVPTAEQLAEWKRSAGATVNRELANLRSALEYASKQTPPKLIRIPHFHRESERENVRKVVLQDKDYAAVRNAFNDRGVQLLFVISCHVGIRASELKRIKWSQVDLERKIVLLERGRTKNKDPRSAPIFGDMTPYLEAEKKQHDELYPESPWVFSRAGSQIRDCRAEWKAAVKRAGVPDLHFHDLRRTAQRLMRRAGVDKITRMRIMGHKTDAMDIRYGVVEDEDIVDAGSKLEVAFGNILAPQKGDGRRASDRQTEPQTPDSELLERIAKLPEEKRKALIALLGA